MPEGIIFNPDKLDIKNVIIENSGNITAISRHYGINRYTIYLYYERHPEVKEWIDEARKKSSDFFLDHAENVFMFNLKNYESEPSIAQRAAEKVLEWRGKSRGWNCIEDMQIPPRQNEIKEFDDYALMMAENIALKEKIAKYENK